MSSASDAVRRIPRSAAEVAAAGRRRASMQCMLLIYGDQSSDPQMDEGDQAAEMQRWYDYSDWLRTKGWVKAGDALQPVEQATSVRVRDGDRLVTDGPFAGTKETL